MTDIYLALCSLLVTAAFFLGVWIGRTEAREQLAPRGDEPMPLPLALRVRDQQRAAKRRRWS